MNFAELFNQLRRELDLTQTELAELLGISQSAYSKIEAGKLTDPGGHVVVKAWRLAREEGGFIRKYFEEFFAGE